jgi:hypothetical protein
MSSSQECRSAPVACDLGAFGPGDRERHAELAKILRGAVIRVEEIEHGFTATLPSDRKTTAALEEWVGLEARCCPFLSFDLREDAAGGERVVAITGPEGTRAFLRAHYGFGEITDPAV